jgi:enoyl-CoA hydratase/carnithine racemase
MTKYSGDGTESPISVSGDEVRVLMLQRPETRNALDGELHMALVDTLDDLAADPRVRAVVLTGSGPAFSAGGDLALIRTIQNDRQLRARTLKLARRLFQRFVTLEVPIIAAVNGPAIGAGCTLALLCDVVFMAEEAYLADPHVNIGLVPGDGGTVLWPMMAGLPAARAYLLTGDRVPASEAHRLGLAHQVVPAGDLMATALSFAQRIGARSAFAVRETKRALNLHLADAAGISFEAAIAAEDRSLDSAEHIELLNGGREQLRNEP